MPVLQVLCVAPVLGWGWKIPIKNLTLCGIKYVIIPSFLNWLIVWGIFWRLYTISWIPLLSQILRRIQQKQENMWPSDYVPQEILNTTDLYVQGFVQLHSLYYRNNRVTKPYLTLREAAFCNIQAFQNRYQKNVESFWCSYPKQYSEDIPETVWLFWNLMNNESYYFCSNALYYEQSLQEKECTMDDIRSLYYFNTGSNLGKNLHDCRRKRRWGFVVIMILSGRTYVFWRL